MQCFGDPTHRTIKYNLMLKTRALMSIENGPKPSKNKIIVFEAPTVFSSLLK